MANDVDRSSTQRWPWGCVTGLAVLLAGTATGGVMTHRMAMAHPWTKAGLPVTVTKIGEWTFLTVGCLAGLACIAIIFSMVCLFLDSRGTLRRWQKGPRALLLVLVAALVGLASAAGSTAVLQFVIDTMPDEALDVLTDEIPKEETPLPLDDDVVSG
jgi:hypothetical protein